MPRSKRSNGEGTVVKYVDKKTGNIYWHARIIWKDSAGATHEKGFTRKTRALAKAALDEFRKKIMVAPDVDSNAGKEVFKNVYEAWIRELAQNERRPSTIDSYYTQVRIHAYPFIESTPIAQISHQNIQNIVSGIIAKGLGQRVISKIMELITVAFYYCIFLTRIKTAYAS